MMKNLRMVILHEWPSIRIFAWKP